MLTLRALRAYMEATFMFRLTPLCAKDDDRAPVRRAIWKPTPKIFSSIGNGGSSAEIFCNDFAPDFFSLISP